MEFWGVEVKAGEKLKVQPQYGQLIHISQAALGEVKDAKGAKYVPLRVRINDKSFIIGSLSAENRPQAMFDLVFEKEFELSHDWKNGSIHFLGYVADDPATEGEEFSSGDDESEDELLLENQENGFPKAKDGAVKKEKAAAAKAGAKDKAKEDEEQESEDGDDSESDSDDEMDLHGTPQMDSSDVSVDDSDDEDEDDDDSEEEELPKVQQSKKRPAVGSAEKTPVSKKAKSNTPDKTGKKGQNATPAPSKSGGKTPNNKKEQTPKSGGQVSCKSCTKTFNSESAMQSHAKAKHGGK